MSFTATELEIVNMALASIGATRIASIADTTTHNAVQCLLHYEQTRDALLRSFLWNFAKSRSQLVAIQTMTLDTRPYAASWAVGDTITGITSGVTATVLTATSPTVYEISYMSGTFTDGEKITNGDVETVYWEGQTLTYESETVYYWDTADSEDIQCGTGYPSVADATPDFEWEYQFLLPSDYSRMVSNFDESDFDDPAERWQIEGKKLLTNDSTASIHYIRKVTDPTEFDSLFTEVLILQLALKLIPALAGTTSAARRQEMKDDLRAAMSKARSVHRQETNTSGQSNWNNARFYADNSTEHTR